MGSQMLRKPRVVCLHGFRTSAEILKKQVLRWPLTVLDKLDLVFLDAPFPAQGKSDVEAFFDPPYYEWFQANQNFTEYTNFEECLEYIENYMIKNGPFDGFLGFSQGAVLSAALPGMQRDGLALTRIPKIKFLILISGAKFGWSKFGHHKLSCKAFSTPLECPSLHITGEMDFMKPESTALLESFVDPFVINHPKGHTVPRLDERSTEVMLEFIERIKKTTATDDEQNRSA
ncbi:hypothetical protein F3Y22_tig00111947pilonHSYRG00156 [Hibiscus syriacus]|uniref:Serine hydrolase domain-containing protein n=1 Tax=Hibiscus syriacus TaxID=106335 RepID=A0A6A2YAN6_HIBSY|nr:esterase OVCA2-like isoform X2 [Hibiscus syriacus]KAE8671509.1 hypothetical protein F3Y22_tig00111947pilonHSYRG00156 [Hibiscus syriacus]